MILLPPQQTQRTSSPRKIAILMVAAVDAFLQEFRLGLGFRLLSGVYDVSMGGIN